MTRVDVHVPGRDWADLTNQAVAAFAEDMDKPVPETWDDVKAYVEKYLKPLIFAHLSGATRDPESVKDVRALADAVESDRGTAQKQVERYLERFGR